MLKFYFIVNNVSLVTHVVFSIQHFLNLNVKNLSWTLCHFVFISVVGLKISQHLIVSNLCSTQINELTFKSNIFSFKIYFSNLNKWLILKDQKCLILKRSNFKTQLSMLKHYVTFYFKGNHELLYKNRYWN